MGWAELSLWYTWVSLVACRRRRCKRMVSYIKLRMERGR